MCPKISIAKRIYFKHFTLKLSKNLKLYSNNAWKIKNDNKYIVKNTNITFKKSWFTIKNQINHWTLNGFMLNFNIKYFTKILNSFCDFNLSLELIFYTNITI